jgi:hypothetical protein
MVESAMLLFFCPLGRTGSLGEPPRQMQPNLTCSSLDSSLGGFLADSREHFPVVISGGAIAGQHVFPVLESQGGRVG